MNIKQIMILFIAIMMISSVNAIGIYQDSKDFSDVNGQIISVGAGQTAKHNIRIKNAETETKSYLFKWDTQGIATTNAKSTYTLQPDEVAEITFDISVPAGTPVGTSKTISFTIQEADSSGQGQVLFAQSVGDKFVVQVVPTVEGTYNTSLFSGSTPIYGGVLIVLIIIGALIAWSKFKK